jgi:hypothetical protein
MPGGKGYLVPKNQFQRPLPVKHTHNVPRHGKPLPPQAKADGKPVGKELPASLPPLSALLTIRNDK